MPRDPLERNLEFLIDDVARLLRNAYDRRVRPLGLTRSQWWVLAHLVRRDGVTQTELAEVLEVGKAALGNLLDRLEEKRWVERRPDPRDKRARRVYLSPAAGDVLDAMWGAGRELHHAVAVGMSQAEVDRLVELLLIAKDNLSAAEHGRAPDRAGAKGPRRA